MIIVVSGLGRMGTQIARKLAEDNHEVWVNNRSPKPVKKMVRYGTNSAFTKEEALQAFGSEPPKIWIMLPADIIDQQLKEWLDLLPNGSLLIDGGNSDFRLTKKRAVKVQAAGSRLLDVGTSGGVWGYQNGFSMMIGGDKTDFKTIEPVLMSLALPKGGYQYFGESGSGHFVKMVHNAVEYGMMESLAEGYRLLKEGPYTDLDLSAAGEVWQKQSVINSWLNELAAEALREDSQLSDINGVVSESGEARWALETAKDLGIPLPAIQAAFEVRLSSQKGNVSFTTKLLAAMRYKFGGHDLNPKN